jgi:hypothetical protein
MLLDMITPSVRRAAIPALLAGGLLVAVLRAEQGAQVPRLAPALHAVRTEEAMRAAIAPYVHVGRPLAATTDGLHALGFRCKRATLEGAPGVDGPMFCSYHLPGDDPRAWDVVLSARGDRVIAYGVSQPDFLERYGREVLARERAGRPRPNIGDFVPTPAAPGAPAPQGPRAGRSAGSA